MGWLSKRLGFKLDSHSLANLAKNLSPLVALTPAGALGAGALAAAGEFGRGKRKLSDLARAGLSNAGIGQGLKYGVGKLSPRFAPSSSVGTSTVYTQAPDGSYLNAATGMPATAATAAPSVPGSNPLKALSRPFAAVGSAVKKDPLAALQLAGSTAGGILGAREQAAQTDLAREGFDFQKQQYADQQARRKRLQELLAPLLQPQGY